MSTLESYGDALVSGIEPEHMPLIGRSLYVIAQWLLFYSVVLGRNIDEKFRLGKLLMEQNELRAELAKMPDEVRNVVLRRLLDISLRQVGPFMPFVFEDRDEDHSEEGLRDRLANYLKISAPLLDGFDLSRTNSKRPSRAWRHSLYALKAGELPALFRPARRGGRSTRPYTDWSFKYELYRMREPLRAAGIKPSDVEELYKVGAGAGWDTASRWRDGAKRDLPKWTRKDIKRKIRQKVAAGLFADPETAKATMMEVCKEYQAFRRGER